MPHVPLWVVVALKVVDYLASNAIASLDSPTEASTARYRFWFRYLNLLASNTARSKLWNRGAE